MSNPGAVGSLHVRGLRELNTSFKRMSVDLHQGLKDEFLAIGEPVREAAEKLAVTEIRNMDEHWSRMRLGVTAKSVYMVPASRRRGGKKAAGRRRPNLAPLLLDRAMEPALKQNEARIVHGFERMIDRIADGEGF